MKKLLIVAALLVTGCTKELVPTPEPFNPPAILMQPPHTTKTITKPVVNQLEKSSNK